MVGGLQSELRRPEKVSGHRRLWMTGVIAWWVLDGYYYFLVGSGWLLSFPVHTLWHIAS